SIELPGLCAPPVLRGASWRILVAGDSTQTFLNGVTYMKGKLVRLGLWFAIGIMVLPAMAQASGGNPMPPPPATPGNTPGNSAPELVPRKSPAEEAAELYNEGIQHRDKALALQKEAAAAADEKDRGKPQKKAQ